MEALRWSVGAKPGSGSKSLLDCLALLPGVLYLQDKGHPESPPRSMECLELTPAVTAESMSECSTRPRVMTCSTESLWNVR